MTITPRDDAMRELDADAGRQQTLDVRLRLAVPADYERVGELTYVAYASDGLLDVSPDYAKELRDAASRARDAELIVAVDPADRVIGAVTLCLPDSPYAELAQADEAEFRMLAVDPAARGQGVGELLVRECLNRAARMRFNRVVISTQWNMRPAHRLYRRLGFVRAPSRDWWPMPDIELICYVKSLDG